MGRTMPAKPFKRAGLHRLECPDCQCYGYFTVAMLERAGELPVCFARGCSAIMLPAELELALLLDVDCPATAEYQAEMERVQSGQARRCGYGHAQSVDPSRWRDAADVAAERVAKRRRETARARRIQALRPAPKPMPF